jgi:hypothetical protein
VDHCVSMRTRLPVEHGEIANVVMVLQLAGASAGCAPAPAR